MSKLILASGKETVKKFEKIGYRVVRQTGSHIRMRHFTDKSKNPLTIPNHPVIGRGLLRKILRDADITVEEFNNL